MELTSCLLGEFKKNWGTLSLHGGIRLTEHSVFDSC